MATLVAPQHADPIADAEALRKACEGNPSSSNVDFDLCLVGFIFIVTDIRFVKT